MKIPIGAYRRGKLFFYNELSQREMGTFNNFVKTRGAGESPKQRKPV